MNAAVICRVIAGVLVLLIGGAVGAGGLQLWRHGPKVWPDVIASEAIVQRVSGGMLVMAGVLLVAALAAMGNNTWGVLAAWSATMTVVIAAFWVNYLLFGSVRATHMATNIAVAAIIGALLWVAYAGQPS